MTKTTSAIKAFIVTHDSDILTCQNLGNAIEAICGSEHFRGLLLALINSPAFSKELGDEFAAVNAIEGLSACRKLRSSLNLSLSSFFGFLQQLIASFDPAAGAEWSVFADKIHKSS